MKRTPESMDLAGQILIAMPGMADPRFDHSVILICAHSDEGAMGLIINKPLEEMSFSRLLDQLSIPRAADGRDIRVLIGVRFQGRHQFGQFCGPRSP